MFKPFIRANELDWRMKRDATAAPAAIRRVFETQIKAVEGETRAFDFTISTGSVDRYGDTVAPDGWKLTNYRKNPVVLWMHDNTMLPVGRGSNVRVEDGALKSRVEITPEGLLRFNDSVAQMLQLGFLHATSVGFLPVKYNFVDDPQRRFGIDFLEQELLEFSIVTVPANAEALIEGRDFESPEAPVAPAPSEPLLLDLERDRFNLRRLIAA